MIASVISVFGDMMLSLYNDPNLLVEFSKNAADIMNNYWNYQLYEKCLAEVIKKVEKYYNVNL